MNPERDQELVPFDPEIERTFRARRREQQGLAGLGEMAEEGVGNNRQQGNQLGDPIALADDRNRAIREYAVPALYGLNPGIIRPEIQAPQFELKPVMFQMLQTVGQFSGMPTEDPHLHLRLFMEVSDSFKLPGVTEEALRLKLFPYSLRDRARAWLNSLPPDSVASWNDLAEKFLMKYFPPTKNARMRNEITSFQQLDGENLHEAWERYKELLRKCPHHGIPHWIQMETFYNGLNGQTRTIVDASANGAILSKSYNEAYEILERMANNNYQWPAERTNAARRVAGVHEVDAITALSAQVSSLTNMLKTMSMPTTVNSVQANSEACVYCGEGHLFADCPANPASACYVGNVNRGHNPFSNHYNPGWRQHPNFAWNNQGAGPSGANTVTKPTHPPGYPPQPQRTQATEQLNPFENLLKEYMARTDAVIQSHSASLRNLENQLGQIASALSNRPQGSLPSNIENPRQNGKEQCQAISLRSGKQLEPVSKSKGVHKEPTSIQENLEQTQQQEEPVTDQKARLFQNATAPASAQHSATAETSNIRPPPPFPQRFQQQHKDKQFRKFLDVLKQLHINIPLVEALEQMPNYAKFMKDLVTKKRRFGEFETVALTEESSAILQNKLPQKLQDPGSFTIPCSIGNHHFSKVLCDLGASINLMPMSIFKKLGIGEARPTTVTLQLADRSITHPEGKIEDVLVKVDKFIFPVDFIILDYEADREVPIILGRPFLATGRTLIDVQKGELTMRVQDEQVTFNVFRAMRLPDESEECSVISVIDNLATEELRKSCYEDSLEMSLLCDSDKDEKEVIEQVMWLEANARLQFPARKFEPLELSSREFKPSSRKSRLRSATSKP